MSHVVSFNPSTAVVEPTSGSSVLVYVIVSNATQPEPATATVGVTALFGGEPAEAGLTVEFQSPTQVPQVTVDVSGMWPAVTAEVGEPEPIDPGQWRVPVTLTVV